MNKYDNNILRNLTTVDYQVVMLPDLPSNEVVTLNPDNSYTIFIKDSLDYKTKKNLFIHAAKHILKDDFYVTDKTAGTIENEARKSDTERRL